MLLGYINTKVGRENLFIPATGNEILHGISNDSGISVVKFATPKTSVKRTPSPHRHIHKFTWTSLDGKYNNQIDNILIDRRRHSSVLDARFFRAANYDTNHYLVVAKFWERPAVNKLKTTHISYGEVQSQDFELG
jgi:hypothetical protein